MKKNRLNKDAGFFGNVMSAIALFLGVAAVSSYMAYLILLAMSS